MINDEKRIIQLEAFNSLRKSKFNGGVILPTGTGKSWVLIECAKKFPKDYSFLYCCDNKKLRDEDFPAELQKWGGRHLDDRIKKLCYQSAYKLEGHHFDVLLMDEGDYALTPEYIKLLENNTFKHILFVSATLDSDKRDLLEQFVPIVYEKDVKEVEDRQVINKAHLYVVNFLLTKAENNKYLAFNEVYKHLLNKERIDHFKLKQVTMNRKHFLSGLESARNSCQKLAAKLYVDPSKKILIFCSLSEQADSVCKYSYHTKNQKGNQYLNLFDKGKLRIISVVGKINRGVNLDGVNCVIFESPGKSGTKAIQQSGRARRLDIDEVTDIYFLIPFYKDRRGEIKPTIVQEWVVESTKDFNQNFKVIKL